MCVCSLSKWAKGLFIFYFIFFNTQSFNPACFFHGNL